MANLNFISTETVEQFKISEGVSRIDVKQSPVSRKLFFSYGTKTGAVAVKGIPQHPMFSLVNGSLNREPNEEERKYIGKTVKDAQGNNIPDPRANGFFFLLHEEGQGGAPVLASF